MCGKGTLGFIVHYWTKERKQMGEETITPSKTTEKILKDIAKETGKTYEDLLKMYYDARAVLDKPQYTEQLNDEKARARVRSALRSEMASPAPVWTGMVLAASEAFNINERHYVDAAAKFASDEKDQWIDKGFITSEGLPVDQREFYRTGRKNPGHRKPYPRFNWLRNAVGVLSTGTGEPLPAKITLSRQVALRTIPLNIPVQVRLNNRTPEGVTDELILTGATVTQFRPIDDPDIPHPEDVIEKYLAKYFCSLINILEHHNGFIINKKAVEEQGARPRLDPTRLTLLDANLVFVDPEPNETTGNHRLVVDDDSIGFGEEDEGRRGTVIWLPKEFYPEIEHAGRGTRMYIMGQTTQPQRSMNFETGEMENVPGDVGMNATGLIVRRGWFMEKEEENIEGEEVE